MFLRLLSFLLLATCSSVHGQFSTGATEAECDTLQPAGSTPATGTEPFFVALTSPSYTPGGTAIQVFVVSANDINARGFVLQARRASEATDNTPFGSFNDAAGDDYQLLQCGSSAAGTITNINNNDKRLPLQFMWNPPAENVGSVEFVVSLVDSDGQFWSNVFSTTSLASTAGELNLLSIDTCPVPFINNNVATWNAPNCFRDAEVQANSANCDPPSPSTFPVGTSTIICTCDDRGESAQCLITVDIQTDDPCDPNPCENGGTCIPVSGLPSGFFCQCPQGFPQPTCTGNTPPNRPNCPSPDVTAIAPPGSTGVQVDYGAVQCTDVQDGIITATCDFPSGSFFSLGTTPVVCTCLDSGALTSGCPFNVIVTTDGVCANNPCSGNECRESATSLAGYTCHSVTGTPCDLA